MENNRLRNLLVDKLSVYYKEVDVNPSDFHCPHEKNCLGNLARGKHSKKYNISMSSYFLK